ncbi:NUDIX hydrolase [Kordiimonas sp. SCSIO 12610]|uniref:NUDIX hydrolase n=1 Tax=Kordiimonas sp. SCSIO 12610 TaxID=2829597 RepID=UPI00210B6702|nr:NUDIX hydrolase [Kordiimonas sp. SCSIO 12610]UTW55623.1 NUDIX hydrolase [Kordiimonas sp. SCSIO 12610]
MSTIIYPNNFSQEIPEGDDHTRAVCGDCGFIAYENPKIIAGSVVAYNDQILLCRRAIEPRKGFWTIPAGFMELGETPAEGAAREAWEEARAKIKVHDLLAIYTVKRISQVHMMYRASLDEPVFEPGPESLEVKLFSWDDIPWDELAFPSVHWALTHYKESMDQNTIAPHTNPEKWKDV